MSRNGRFFTGVRAYSGMIVPVVFLSLFLGAHDAAAQKKDIKKIRQEAEKRYLSGSGKNNERYKGNFYLDRGEKLDANLVVTGGNAEIDGEVFGTVIVIDGDIRLGRTGIIRGDAVAVTGDIIRRTGSVIVGDEIQISWRTLVSRSERKVSKWQDRRLTGTTYSDWDRELIDKDVYVRYNRVEGLFFGLAVNNPDWNDSRILYLYGDGGYGFKSKEWRYTIGLEHRFFDVYQFRVGVKKYDLTDTDDGWRIGRAENSLAAFLLREDFFDYYNRQGYTAYMKQYIDNWAKLQLEYRVDTFESMLNSASWSLFGGNKVFRANPLINEGDMRSINFSVLFDTGNSYLRANKGWKINGDVEYTSPDIGGDFDYERYILDIRRYQPVSRYENLNMRLMFGSSKGALPIQRGFYLGGISSLRGMRFKEFSGTSMFLANIDYIFDPNRLLAGPPSWILNDFRLAFFFDAGAVTMTDVKDYDDIFDKNIFMHNVGIGFLSQDEDFRIDFAWRTDKRGEPMRVTFRLIQTF